MKKITELTEKQQEQIIKNCVECIMDDWTNFILMKCLWNGLKKICIIF